MNRRKFLAEVIPVLAVGSTAAAVPLPEPSDSLVFRGDNVSVFRRKDGIEAVVIAGERGYFRGTTWILKLPCAEAFNGWVTDLFYGLNARENAEKAARTCVIGKHGGWPCIIDAPVV
jgi:hypothetical protein